LNIFSTLFFSFTMSHLPRLSRRPTRTKSARVASSLSILFLAFIAIIALSPVAVKADEHSAGSKSEYGTVIGIGASVFLTTAMIAMTNSRCQILEQRMSSGLIVVQKLTFFT
jgi:hypothetical protein